jgi:hypothetical protein
LVRADVEAVAEAEEVVRRRRHCMLRAVRGRGGAVRRCQEPRRRSIEDPRALGAIEEALGSRQDAGVTYVTLLTMEKRGLPRVRSKLSTCPGFNQIQHQCKTKTFNR